VSTLEIGGAGGAPGVLVASMTRRDGSAGGLSPGGISPGALFPSEWPLLARVDLRCELATRPNIFCIFSRKKKLRIQFKAKCFFFCFILKLVAPAMLCVRPSCIQGRRIVEIKAEQGAEVDTYVFEANVFRSTKSSLDVYVNSVDDSLEIVLKKVKNPTQIREEHAAIKFFQEHPDLQEYFVQSLPLMSYHQGADSFFTFKGAAFYVMPYAGIDLQKLAATVHYTSDEWLGTCLHILRAAAYMLLQLWLQADATYLDVKARNIIAMGDWNTCTGRVDPGIDLIFCDISSINSRTATHHPPTYLTQHTSRNTQYRVYIAWSFACLFLELDGQGEVTKILRTLRKSQDHSAENLLNRNCTELDARYAGCRHHGVVGRLFALLKQGRTSGHVCELLLQIVELCSV
jgi:hypothetical protein